MRQQGHRRAGRPGDRATPDRPEAALAARDQRRLRDPPAAVMNPRSTSDRWPPISGAARTVQIRLPESRARVVSIAGRGRVGVAELDGAGPRKRRAASWVTEALEFTRRLLARGSPSQQRRDGTAASSPRTRPHEARARPALPGPSPARQLPAAGSPQRSARVLNGIRRSVPRTRGILLLAGARLLAISAASTRGASFASGCAPWR
jgi:hypothetical protein